MTGQVAALSLAAALVCVQTPSGPQMFRSSTHAVVVDAAIFDSYRVVADLKIGDFELRDNGVVQALTSADFNTLPIDLRLVVDISGSISDDDLARYLRTMRQVTEKLEPRDQCEIITFNARIADAAARQSPPVKIELTRTGQDGTAFFDAASLALVTIPTPERRQITIVLSDASDNASFFDETTLIEAARRTDTVVYTVLPGDPTLAKAVSVARLQALSLLTGGRLTRTPDNTVAAVINDAIWEFRQSYVLRYTLTGVKVDGWHKIEIKVRGGSRYHIRARTGYFGR